MEKRPIILDRLAKLRAQRWSREVLLAALLTLAAVIFIATAMVGKESTGHGRNSVETARTPQE